MPVLPGSVSRTNKPRPFLVVGPNWMGDSIMAMPGVRAFMETRPGLCLHMLVKHGQAGLWRLATPAPEQIIVYGPGLRGVLRAALTLRRMAYAEAYVLPRSFRSVLPLFLAGIPMRIGLPGHARDWMLTRVVQPPDLPEYAHQAYECMELFGLGSSQLTPLNLAVPETARQAARAMASAGCIVLAPGARRGPSKRWPAAAFAEVGRMLSAELGRQVVVVGAGTERDLCSEVAENAGAALCLAGRTSIAELAALFEFASVVIANDSGPMHLAAAAGAAVVAIFGITDPDRTGPLGRRAVVLQESALKNRDIPRNSQAAALSLAKITPTRVFEVARKLALENNAHCVL